MSMIRLPTFPKLDNCTVKLEQYSHANQKNNNPYIRLRTSSDDGPVLHDRQKAVPVSSISYHSWNEFFRRCDAFLWKV